MTQLPADIQAQLYVEFFRNCGVFLNLLVRRFANYITNLVSFGESRSLSGFQRDLICDSITQVILFYDYFLTFSDEVERFWNRKNFNWSSFLFLANRYMVLFGNIPVMFEGFWESNNFSNKNLVNPLPFHHVP